MKNLQDESLVELIKQSNHLAFQAFYQRHWEQLYLKAYAILGHTQMAEDIIQDIFLDIWKNRERIEIDKPIQYLSTCVKNSVFKVLQKQKVKQKHLDTLNTLELLVQAASTLDSNEIEQAIMKHLDQMPDRCKEIFILSRFENLSNKEIAEKLGLSAKTVENQIYRALKSLKTLMPQLLSMYFLLIFEEVFMTSISPVLPFC
ncbi:RNA polymerase sigma-70 factor [Belliella kenyensis]|nr:RNA polymerase sigma-70 factor [Belliella kenyensis]MCH7400846.1 RNA polymerase sigma-70 factor [Belliella kenyensis]MDN3601866.1 RNA polymerase sigma-70 factor [Belliella kenyensis]